MYFWQNKFCLAVWTRSEVSNVSLKNSQTETTTLWGFSLFLLSFLEKILEEFKQYQHASIHICFFVCSHVLNVLKDEQCSHLSALFVTKNGSSFCSESYSRQWKQKEGIAVLEIETLLSVLSHQLEIPSVWWTGQTNFWTRLLL